MTAHHEPKSFLDIEEPHELADSFRSRHVHFKGLFASLSKDATEVRRNSAEKTKEISEREGKIFSRATKCIEKFCWPLPYHPYVKDNNMDAAQYFTQIPVPQGNDSYSATPNLMSPHPSQIVSVSQTSPNRESPSQSVRANLREKASHARPSSSKHQTDSRKKLDTQRTKEDFDIIIAGLLETIVKIKSVPKFTEFSIPTDKPKAKKSNLTSTKTQEKKTITNNEKEEGEASDDESYAKRNKKDVEKVNISSKPNGHTGDSRKSETPIDSHDVKVERVKQAKRLSGEVDSESDATNKRLKTTGKREISTKQSEVDSNAVSSFDKPRPVSKIVELKYPDKSKNNKRDPVRRKNRGSYSSSEESNGDSDNDNRSRRLQDSKYEAEEKIPIKKGNSNLNRTQLDESNRHMNNETKRTKLPVKSKPSSRQSQNTDSDSEVDTRLKKNPKSRKSMEQHPDDSDINTNLDMKIKAAKAARRSQNEESDVDAADIEPKLKKIKASKVTSSKPSRHNDSDIESDIDYKIKKIKANRSEKKADDTGNEPQYRKRSSGDPTSDKKAMGDSSLDNELLTPTNNDSKARRISNRSPKAAKPLKRSSSVVSYSDESEAERTRSFAIPEVEERSNAAKKNGRSRAKEPTDSSQDYKSRRNKNVVLTDVTSDPIKSRAIKATNTKRNKEVDTSEAFSEPSKLKSTSSVSRKNRDLDLEQSNESTKVKASRRLKEADIAEDKTPQPSISRKSKEDITSEDEKLSQRASLRKVKKDVSPTRERRVERNDAIKSKQSSEVLTSPSRSKNDKKRIRSEDTPSSREHSRPSASLQTKKSGEDVDSISRGRNSIVSKDRSRSRSMERREIDFQERERTSIDKRSNADKLDRSSSTLSEKSSSRDRQRSRESRIQRRPSPSRSQSPIRRSRDDSRDSRFSDRHDKASTLDNSHTSTKPIDDKYSSSKYASADRKSTTVKSKSRDNIETDDKNRSRSKDESRDNTDIEDRKPNRSKEETSELRKSRPSSTNTQAAESKQRESIETTQKKTLSLADYRKQKPEVKTSRSANSRDDSPKETKKASSENGSSKDKTEKHTITKSTDLSPESTKSYGSGAPASSSVNTPTPLQKTPSRDNVYTPMRELGSSVYKPTTAEIEHHRIEYVRYNNLARDYKRKAVENAESGNAKRVKESTPQFLASLYAFIRSIACFQVSRHGSYKECISHWESLEEFMAYTRRKLRLENYTDLNALCAKIDALINLRIVRLRQAYCNDILMSKNLRKLSTNKEEQIRQKVFNDVANQCGRQKDTMDRVHRKWTEGEQIFTLERLEARFSVTYRKCHGPEKTLQWPLLQDPNFDELLKFAESVFDEYLEKHNISFEALPFEVNEYDPKKYKNKEGKEMEIP